MSGQMADVMQAKPPFCCLQCRRGRCHRKARCDNCLEINAGLLVGIPENNHEALLRYLRYIPNIRYNPDRCDMMMPDVWKQLHQARSVVIHDNQGNVVSDVNSVPCPWCKNVPREIPCDCNNGHKCPPIQPWYVGYTRTYQDICESLLEMHISWYKPETMYLVGDLIDTLEQMHYIDLGFNEIPPCGPISLLGHPARSCYTT